MAAASWSRKVLPPTSNTAARYSGEKSSRSLRPMSTRTGLPTAAIYVFVNMLRKLREDFSPEYLAAVFDVGGKTFRDQEASTITTVRKFDLKTQSFQEIQYHGYKANRSEMPEDLVQQVPYIRKALEG